MDDVLILTPDPIDEPALVAGRRAGTGHGAVVTFLGIVRDREGDSAIRGLRYTSFEAMARHQFGLLFTEARRRWPVHSIRLVHRLGDVPAGEASLWLEVVARHRAEALATCGWLIDEMKRVVPIWKEPLR